MKRYHVTEYYLATGMEGIPHTFDYGFVTAESPDAAKDKVITEYHATESDRDKKFIRGCLSATEIS